MSSDYPEYDQAREIAWAIMVRNSFLTTSDNEEMYYYDNGIYHANAETQIKREVQDHGSAHEVKITSHFVNEVINNIKRETYTDREKFNKHKHLVHLKNGIFNLKAMKLEPFNPRIISTTRLPITYDEKAGCPNTKKFFSEVLYEEDIKTIQELFGYCLYKSYPIQKAFMFLGEGANGKSTLLRLLGAFLGKKNTVSVALQQLGSDRFATARLYGKHANIYPDLSGKAMYLTDKFKFLTGGDTLEGQRKFREPFDFVSFAKLCFSANRPPEVMDDTDAFFRRWMTTTFPNKFEEEEAIDQDFLLDGMTTEQELSGLFNWAVEGLKRLFEQKKFSNSKSTEEMRTYYKRISSPIEGFAMDCLETGAGEWVSKNELYSAFIRYCNKHKLPKRAKNKFGMDIQSVVPEIGEESKRTGKKRQRCWTGISLKTPRNGVKKGKQGTLVTKNGFEAPIKEVQTPQKTDRFAPSVPLKTPQNGVEKGKRTLVTKVTSFFPSKGQFENNIKVEKTVLPSLPPSDYGFKEQIMGFLREYDELPIEQFKSNNEETKAALARALKELMREGRIYEPKKGVYRLVGGQN